MYCECVLEVVLYHSNNIFVCNDCTFVNLKKYHCKCCLYAGFYTEWLMYASFVGFVIMLYGFSTIPEHRNALA